MKILLVHKFFKYSGGADVFFFETGRVLKERGHQVAYFSTKDKDNFPSEWNTYFSEAPAFRSGNTGQKLKALAQIPYNLEAQKNFECLLNDFRPDLIHAFGIMSHISPSILVSARKRGIPVVISLNDYKHICPNYKLYQNGKICERCKGGGYFHCLIEKCSHNSLSFSFASMIEAYIHKWLDVYRKNISLFLFSSDFMAEKTEEFWGRKIPRGKLMNPFLVSSRPSLLQPGEYGLYFGRLVDEKGIDILLKALSVAREVPFKIVGDGPDTDYLKQFATSCGLENVEFLGSKWGDELNKYLRKAKYVVVPSIWHENFPYVILQAFDAVKPVIGSRRGGIPEMISQERGLLYEADDFYALAALLKRLDSDSEECMRLGENGRSYVESSFNDDQFYKSIMENYAKVIQIKEVKNHD